MTFRVRKGCLFGWDSVECLCPTIEEAHQTASDVDYWEDTLVQIYNEDGHRMDSVHCPPSAWLREEIKKRERMIRESLERMRGQRNE